MEQHSTRILDHIVHLTPPGSLPEAIEHFRFLGFTVLPGGTHDDDLTSNALVVLGGGVYLELLAFTHHPSHYPAGSPERHKRVSHPWASKQPGWVEWVLLGLGENVGQINERAAQEMSEVRYLIGQDGGRTTPDGKELKWKLAIPESIQDRGMLPLFCQDLTPREWRVPPGMQHSCTAIGISHITLRTDFINLLKLSDKITSILGDGPISVGELSHKWTLETPIDSGHSVQLVLEGRLSPEYSLPGEEDEFGIKEVGIYVKERPPPRIPPEGDISWILIPAQSQGNQSHNEE